MPDGLHPNDLGYHIFASAIEPAVSFLLDDESANDTRDKLC
jgi:lysophospholipase L1-like esterase